MARVTEEYDVVSLLDDLEEYRFIDDDTIVRISALEHDDVDVFTLQQLNFFQTAGVSLSYSNAIVCNFTFNQRNNILFITTY